MVSYVTVDPEQCNGCVLCMKACPTKAIRVRNGCASIEGVCIDCVECVRVCPRGAIRPVTTGQSPELESPYTAVSASTVIYSQFPEDVMPNDILLALRRMGFRYVHDQSYTSEIFSTALELYIAEQKAKQDAPWPLISPVCPAVVHLIAHRFPFLLPHLPPLLTPREIVAREAKQRLSKKYGCPEEEITVLHITPCPAKRISIQEPLLQGYSYLDETIPLGEIHGEISRHLKELDEDKVLHHSSGVGLGWGMCGGEIAGLDTRSLAISGLKETILYLEKIEMGLLEEIDYVEFRICQEGCLGGPYTVVDKYLAKRRLERLIRMFGIEKRVKLSYVKELYAKGWFFPEHPRLEDLSPALSIPLEERLEKVRRVEAILDLLPQKECGICGSPDCRSFAEDLLEGKTTPEACSYLDRSRRSRLKIPPQGS